jgi:integrase/recombinase XerD
VFLPDEGMAFFLSLCEGKRPKDFVFLQDDGCQWRQRYNKPFKKAVIAAELPIEFTFHGLRHTYASQLVQAGAPLIVVAEQLGHRSILTVSTVYGHLAPQIRESEVRQRFTSISRRNSDKARITKPELIQLRSGLQREDWRSYANIVDLSARRRTH